MTKKEKLKKIKIEILKLKKKETHINHYVTEKQKK